MKRIILSFVIFYSIPAFSQAKTNVIKGVVTDQNQEPVPFANVTLFQNDSVVLGTNTNFDGEYILKNIEEGEYSMTVRFVGYSSYKIKNLKLGEKTNTMDVNIGLKQGIICFPMIAQPEPNSFRIDETIRGKTFTREEIQHSVYR